MTILVTGVAGFIGFHVARALSDAGHDVVGLDDLNPYYSVALKRARMEALPTGLTTYQGDCSDPAVLQGIADRHPDIRIIVHLAAQAGVRHALTDPYSYGRSNVMGQIAIEEMARGLKGIERVVYASSSSVYGANRTLPFSEAHRTDHPISLYAATKRAAEGIAQSYTALFGCPHIGLRFFTVYGPWGRPDMAVWSFTKAILSDQPITLYGDGLLKRDFTYVDDIVSGVLATVSSPVQPSEHRLYNLGNNHAERVIDLVRIIEAVTGKKAVIQTDAVPPGDMDSTFADISKAQSDLGFRPATPLAEGVPKFVEWFRSYLTKG